MMRIEEVTVEADAQPVERPAHRGLGAPRRRIVGPRALKLLWDAHSLTGVILGLALFVIFYTGAFALFRAELMGWADPALRSGARHRSADAVSAPLFRARPPAPGAEVLLVYPIHGRPFYWLRYPTVAGDTVDHWVSAATGEVLPVRGRSSLSELLYKLHYFAQAGIVGRLVSGVAAVFLLFAVGSGLAIHLRKLPRDWHTFRPRSPLRTALADLHTVLGLVGLPYAVLYAITGAFFSLLIVILGPTLLVVFDGDRAALDAVRTGVAVPPAVATGRAATMLSPGALEAALPASWSGVTPQVLTIHGWGDAGAVAVFEGAPAGSLTESGSAALGGATGTLLVASDPRRPTALGATVGVMTNLHFATVGGWVLKALFFVLALAASAVILTGNVLWLVNRRTNDPRAAPRLHRLLARLSVGVGAGLVVAVPVLFLVAQLLPLPLASRVWWEHVAFFGAWLACVVASLVAHRMRRMAGRLLVLAGVLSALVPVAHWIDERAWPWITAAMGAWGTLWVDGLFLVATPVLLRLAHGLHAGHAARASRAA
ncbi:MAG: PepSY domain-containing protein [Gemmatimonadaceae bacterium]|jgi:uncharacterized iron-regulated membrane protein|nr:PepSY domain-containing protein [Gemmatimonadaceae bacterium]